MSTRKTTTHTSRQMLSTRERWRREKEAGILLDSYGEPRMVNKQQTITKYMYPPAPSMTPMSQKTYMGYIESAVNYKARMLRLKVEMKRSNSATTKDDLKERYKRWSKYLNEAVSAIIKHIMSLHGGDTESISRAIGDANAYAAQLAEQLRSTTGKSHSALIYTPMSAFETLF